VIKYPTSSDIYIEVNGRRLAVAQSYRARTTRDSRYVEAFGSLEPVGATAGRIKHVVELSRVCLSGLAAGDGINFHDLIGFNVVIVKPGCKIIYSGCEWQSIDERADLNTTVLESVSIVASKRMEIA
jgi:hypothetical protein